MPYIQSPVRARVFILTATPETATAPRITAWLLLEMTMASDSLFGSHCHICSTVIQLPSIYVRHGKSPTPPPSMMRRVALHYTWMQRSHSGRERVLPSSLRCLDNGTPHYARIPCLPIPAWRSSDGSQYRGMPSVLATVLRQFRHSGIADREAGL